MLFTTFHFFIFMSVVLGGLYALRTNEQKTTWLLLAGAFFYGYWNWRFLALLAFTATFDYHLGLAIGRAQGSRRKRLVILDIVVNLTILGIFKYANFFLNSLNVLTTPAGLSFHNLQIVLPLGISFFVFEAMSYCIDVYRGTLAPYDNWKQFALFIFFFPRLIAGPIIRAADFLPQLRRPIVLTRPNMVAGLQLFLLGLTKKLVVADNLAAYNDLVFAAPQHFSGLSIWQAVIAYSLQIYCDFSGYSDMAIGLAKMMSFELPINFNLPYIATNLTDFWRRWHISLSTWLRDYLYFPLGGNRKGVPRMYINLLITMVLGGLWHGAKWNFVAWGFLHGLGLAAHKAYSASRRDFSWKGDDAVSRIAGWILTYGFVCFCWVFFRSPSFDTSLLMVRKMVAVGGPGVVWFSAQLLILAPVVFLCHCIGQRMKKLRLTPAFDIGRLSHLTLLMFWIVGILLLANTRSTPFIYFQF